MLPPEWSQTVYSSIQPRLKFFGARRQSNSTASLTRWYGSAPTMSIMIITIIIIIIMHGTSIVKNRAVDRLSAISSQDGLILDSWDVPHKALVKFDTLLRRSIQGIPNSNLTYSQSMDPDQSASQRWWSRSYTCCFASNPRFYSFCCRHTVAPCWLT